jgi:signal peptidase I
MFFLIFSLIIAIIVLAVFFFRIFAVGLIKGRSMHPYLKNNRPFLLRKKFVINKNDVYVIKLDNEERYFVKRLTDITLNPFGQMLLYFTGDNVDESFDSRSFGYIRPQNVIGQVVKII